MWQSDSGEASLLKAFVQRPYWSPKDIGEHMPQKLF